MPSIQMNLIKWLIVPFIIINSISAIITYQLAWEPARIAFDQGISDAVWFIVQQLREDHGKVILELSAQSEKILRLDHFDTIYFVVRTQEIIAGDQDFPELPSIEKLNYPFVYDGVIRSEDVRIIALKTKVGNTHVFIGVAETLKKRNHIKSIRFLVFLVACLVLNMISFVVIKMVVRKGLLPLDKLQSDLRVRGEKSLSAIDSTNMPIELTPITQEINSLLEKIKLESLKKQDFLANVSHQLRTPLATIKLQIELLESRAALSGDIAHSLNLMMSATDRMVRKTSQFLSLARAEPIQFEKTRLKSMRLDQLIQDIAPHFIEEARKKNIDLGFDLEPVEIRGDAFLIQDMIDNLVDNAIRYSPEYGWVTVGCKNELGWSCLFIEDSGQGIPDAEREKVFSRFYRLDHKHSGSGLGLAIVQAIAQDHEAEIVLQSANHGTGCLFGVKFPAHLALQ